MVDLLRKSWTSPARIGKLGILRIYHTEKLECHDIVISSMDGFCMVVGTPIFGNAHLTVVPFFRFLSFQCRFLKKSNRIVFLHLLSCILTWPMAVWRIAMFHNRERMYTWNLSMVMLNSQQIFSTWIHMASVHLIGPFSECSTNLQILPPISQTIA